MKTKEIITKTKADLMKLLNDKKESLRVSRFGTSGSKNKNVKETKELKRDIARILTIINSKND